MWKGLSEQTITEAGILIEGTSVSIPYRKPTGDVFRWRYKTAHREWWGPGEGTVPFGLERLPNALRASRTGLVVTEGESDCLALREALNGSASRLAVIGCPGSLNWQEEWIVYVQDFKQVLAIGDGDDAGARFGDKMCALLPGCLFLQCPEGDDVRSMLQGDDPAEILEAIEEAFVLAELFEPVGA